MPVVSNWAEKRKNMNTKTEKKTQNAWVGFVCGLLCAVLSPRRVRTETRRWKTELCRFQRFADGFLLITPRGKQNWIIEIRGWLSACSILSASNVYKYEIWIGINLRLSSRRFSCPNVINIRTALSAGSLTKTCRSCSSQFNCQRPRPHSLMNTNHWRGIKIFYQHRESFNRAKEIKTEKIA